MATPNKHNSIDTAWEDLFDEMMTEGVLLKSVKSLVRLTGGSNLTGRARVRVAQALTSHGLTFQPASVLTEKDHGDRSELYIFGPGSRIGQALKLAEQPTERGEKRLQALERQLQSSTVRKTHRRGNVDTTARQYLWKS